MEPAHTPIKRTFADCINGTNSGTMVSRRLSSKDRLYVAANIPSTSLHTTQGSNTQHTSDNLSGPSLRQPNKTAVIRGAFQSDRNEVCPRPAKMACLRSPGKKSRCSGLGPSEGRSNDDLDCARDDFEPKSNRRSRKFKSADGAETSQKATEIRGAPLQVRSACTRCQHRKSKCSGTRPACTYCVESQLGCSYDVAEGMTRTSDLKRRLRESSGQAQALGRVLAVMREGTDDQATEVFARLRIGDSLQSVLRSLPTYISSPVVDRKQAEMDRHPSGP